MHAFSGRRVRPRPVNFNERLKVVYLNGDESLEPGLEAFLQAQEEEFTLLKALEEKPSKGTSPQQAHISVPKVRQVNDYATNQAALKTITTRRYNEIDPVTTAYIRSQEVLFAPQTMEQVLMSYDMDEVDEQWLAKYNAKASSKASSSAKQNQQQLQHVALTSEEFEVLVARLETMMQDAVCKEDVGWQADVKADKVPGPLPPPERLLPRGIAAAQLRDRHDQGAVLGVYDHWLSRRRQFKGPLLAPLWFHMPWKATCFESEDDPGMQGDMPFCATETKNSYRGNRLRLSPREALGVMTGLREELELLRILADQVRKRERLKKHLLKIWRAEVLNQPINLASLPPLLPSAFLRPAGTKKQKSVARSVIQFKADAAKRMIKKALTGRTQQHSGIGTKARKKVLEGGYTAGTSKRLSPETDGTVLAAKKRGPKPRGLKVIAPLVNHIQEKLNHKPLRAVRGSVTDAGVKKGRTAGVPNSVKTGRTAGVPNRSSDNQAPKNASVRWSVDYTSVHNVKASENEHVDREAASSDLDDGDVVGRDEQVCDPSTSRDTSHGPAAGVRGSGGPSRGRGRGRGGRGKASSAQKQGLPVRASGLSQQREVEGEEWQDAWCNEAEEEEDEFEDAWDHEEDAWRPYAVSVSTSSGRGRGRQATGSGRGSGRETPRSGRGRGREAPNSGRGRGRHTSGSGRGLGRGRGAGSGKGRGGGGAEKVRAAVGVSSGRMEGMVSAAASWASQLVRRALVRGQVRPSLAASKSPSHSILDSAKKGSEKAAALARPVLTAEGREQAPVVKKRGRPPGKKTLQLKEKELGVSAHPKKMRRMTGGYDPTTRPAGADGRKKVQVHPVHAGTKAQEASPKRHKKADDHRNHSIALLASSADEGRLTSSSPSKHPVRGQANMLATKLPKRKVNRIMR